MKYICTKNENNEEEIFLFPNTVNHDAMGEVLGYIKNQTHGNWERVMRMPISAGFVTADGQCFGRSETLDLDARPEADAELLHKTFNAMV